jgi:WXXGXW repeat (2 copies)
MQLVANRMAVRGLAALLLLGMSRSAAAQMADTTVANVETVKLTGFRSKAPTDPPAAKSETKGTAPSAQAVWVPGFWDLRGDLKISPRAGWVWVPGRWIEPPVPHARWNPGHWGWYDDWYSWIPGHWVVPGRHGYPADLQSGDGSELETSAP